MSSNRIGGKRTRRRRRKKRTRRRGKSRRKRGAVRTKHNTPKVFDPKTMTVIPNPHFKKPKKPSPITLNVQGHQVPFSQEEVEQQRKMLTQLKKLSPQSSSKAFQLGSFNPQSHKGGSGIKSTIEGNSCDFLPHHKLCKGGGRKKRRKSRRKRGGWERGQAGVDEDCIDNGACKKGLQCIPGPTNTINARGTCKDLNVNVNEGGTRGKSRRKSRGKSRRRMRGKRKGKSRRKRKR